MTDPLTLLAAFVVAVIGVARATRLIVHDPYPPVEALRVRWVVYQANRDVSPAGRKAEAGSLASVRYGWGSLVECPFCAAPYITAVALAVGIIAGVWSPDLGTLAGWWWVLAVWATISYLAAILVLRDEPADD